MRSTLRKLTGVPRGRSTMTMPKSKKYKRRALTRLKQVSSRLGLSSPPSCSSSLLAILVTLSALSLTLLALTRTKSSGLDTSTCFDTLLLAAPEKNRSEHCRSGKLLAGYFAGGYWDLVLSSRKVQLFQAGGQAGQVGFKKSQGGTSENLKNYT